ncbi:type II toxin-antitoxin system RelE/ParE family toxin [Algoriphagus sp. A40]|uniref:type II toxin-antitoxin system RelE/ParE family toxin n=1 Tax=Algoriphagus sp. A40 TaxID=1945863 RepID=UPI0009869887
MAIQTLQETVNFLRNSWNDGIVDKFYDLVDQKIDRVQDNPNIGFKVKNSQIRRILVHPNISLFYVSKSTQIKILLIWDNRQDPKDLNEKLKNQE